jgi:hypothetical protein
MHLITKNTILQYGPNKFRNRSKANELLSTLFSQNKILVEKREDTFIAIAGLNSQLLLLIVFNSRVKNNEPSSVNGLLS